MGTSAVVSTFDFTSLYAGVFPVRARTITLVSGSNVAGTPLPRGTLLGRITTSDKYAVCKTGATDGSQTPVAILAFDTDSSAGDAPTQGYFEGEFAFEVMTVDVSWTVTTLQAAMRQAGSALYVRSVGNLG